MNEITNQKLMTVKQIAEVLNISERQINRIGKQLFPEKFLNGKKTYFNEVQSTAIKLQIGKGRTDLDNIDKVANSISTELEYELLRKKLDNYREEKIKRLELENEEMKPKALFYDTVTKSKDCFDMKEVAGLLNIKNVGRNKLFKILREKHILNDNNKPYQRYIDSGYFKLVEYTYVDNYGNQRVGDKPVVFQKGIDYISKLVK